MRLTISIAILLTCFQNLDCLKNNQRLANSRQNFFDIDLLRYSTEDVRGNVMLSPASLKSILAMLLEGAEGQTAKETRSVLRLSPDKQELREQLHLYLTALKANTTGVILENANGVFVSKKLILKKDYVAKLQNFYLTDVNKVDFSEPIGVADYINNWVSQKTRGLIPFIVGPVNINPTSDIFVSNAIYFKSSWHNAFDPKQTHGDCFYNQGVCQTVAMMEMEAELNYAYVENLMAHAVELPYEGNRYSMILLVPTDRDGCSALIRDLPYMSLFQIYELMQPTEVRLSMPKFIINYNEDMVGPLRNMRLTSLFSATSNLSGIFEGDKPYVNSIFHKVYMSVDEAGTVAAAATSAMIVPLIYSGVALNVNKPFVFFIRDNQLGLVLFEGKIEEPTAYVEPDSLIVPEKKPIFTTVIAEVNNGKGQINDGKSQASNEKGQINYGMPQTSIGKDQNIQFGISQASIDKDRIYFEIPQASNGKDQINYGISQDSNGNGHTSDRTIEIPQMNNGKGKPSNETEQATTIKKTGSVSQEKPKQSFFSRFFG